VFAPLITCDEVPLTATEGSTLFITANPTAIPAIGGVSTITVTGFKRVEDGGGPLSDGTQIFLTTNVGVIEERVEMTNGVARGYLRGDGRAGLATVAARSGAGIEATLANPVLIGNAAGINILVTATPATVRPPDFTSQIVATVFDNDNNPLSDVPIVFSTNAGALASNSSILRTNQLGQAADRLTLENEQSATVTATSGAVSASTTVTRGAVDNPIVASISPTSGAPGDTLNVTITGLNFQPGAVVSFGEGIAVNSVNFLSSTQLVANITVDTNIQNTSSARDVTVTNPDGSSGSLDSAFRIVTANPAPEITSLFPTSTATRDVVVTVTINGFNFQAGAQVIFSSPGGSVNIVDTRFNSSSQIEVDIIVDSVPPGPPSGTVFSVRVRNPDGLQSNSANFTTN
jgi:hypothetical protein